MKKRTKTLIGLTLFTSLALAGCSSAQDAAAPATDKKDSAAQTQAQAVDLKQPIADYRTYVIEQADALIASTTQFVNAVKSGNIEEAKKLYAPTRQYYERIEPIAEAFDNLDPDVDARENDVDASEWKGFHKIEKALWEANTTKGEEQTADELLSNVQLLRAKVETADIEPALFVTGPVELLNEVSATKVTGEEERYSHTDLYDFAANVEGADKIFTLLQSTLKAHDAQLTDTIASRFADLNNALSKYKKDSGYVSYTELSKEQTKELSQAVDALAEPLSQMGTVLGANK
ncbi:iron uptake system protein EfeO [Tumebacillus flagellatus]|uniref:Iron ABC transporter substrate-binding protein n=1 Tax=Tumebacillus flagellatus TaxID=1157490 RepID=A0A074LRY0_9BACL|nr:iron ABC transporter substrate-binding protein [Tumebacillus flagellatus]